MTEKVKRIRYPAVVFTISPTVGDGFVLVHRARAALRRGGVSTAECEAFLVEALAGDLKHRIATIKKWMKVKTK